MHAYLITAKPGRLHRAAAFAGRWALRFLALTVMCALGILILERSGRRRRRHG